MVGELSVSNSELSPAPSVDCKGLDVGGSARDKLCTKVCEHVEALEDLGRGVLKLEVVAFVDLVAYLYLTLDSEDNLVYLIKLCVYYLIRREVADSEAAYQVKNEILVLWVLVAPEWELLKPTPFVCPMLFNVISSHGKVHVVVVLPKLKNRMEHLKEVVIKKTVHDLEFGIIW